MVGSHATFSDATRTRQGVSPTVVPEREQQPVPHQPVRGQPTRLLRPSQVPVSAVSAAGDRFELEADAVARAAVAGLSPGRRPGRTHATDSVPESVLAQVEPLLGADLGHVRVRSGAEAAATAGGLNASAFTMGDQIWLGAGASPADTALLAHELTHVVQ